MEKIITTNGFFNKIVEIIKKKENMSFLDYVSANNSEAREITDTAFDVIAETVMGSNKGIYCNFYLSGNIGSEEGRFYIGCFKTLYEDDEHFLVMVQLGAKFQISSKRWIKENLKILNRKGYKLEFYRNNANVFNIHTDNLKNVENIKKHNDWNYDKINIIDLYTLKKIE